MSDPQGRGRFGAPDDCKARNGCGTRKESSTVNKHR
jgi:hypothetical protein